MVQVCVQPKGKARWQAPLQCRQARQSQEAGRDV